MKLMEIDNQNLIDVLIQTRDIINTVSEDVASEEREKLQYCAGTLSALIHIFKTINPQQK